MTRSSNMEIVKFMVKLNFFINIKLIIVKLDSTENCNLNKLMFRMCTKCVFLVRPMTSRFVQRKT